MRKSNAADIRLARRWNNREQKEFQEKLKAKQANDRREKERLADADVLADYEKTIDAGFDTFLDVGRALQAIRDQKLWRHDYDSFESYVKTKWNWTKRYANDVVRASVVARVVGPPYPANESICRAISKLPEEQWQGAWAACISENRHPTAKEFADSLKRLPSGSQPVPQSKPLEDHTLKTLRHLKTTLAELSKGPRSRRQDYLEEIHYYVSERMYFSFGPNGDEDPSMEWEEFDESFKAKG